MLNDQIWWRGTSADAEAVMDCLPPWERAAYVRQQINKAITEIEHIFRKDFERQYELLKGKTFLEISCEPFVILEGPFTIGS